MPNICKSFQPLVDDLKHLRIGVAGQPFIIDELKSGSLVQTDECDRFRLSFKLADNFVRWEIIFDKHRPQFPPDLIFGPDDDDFSPVLEEVKGYCNWNPASKSCLSNMLLDVIKEYIQYRRDGIASLPGLNEQWKAVCDTTNYARSCEVYFSTNGPGTFNATASFMFEFTINISEIPLYLIKGNVGDSKAILHITFKAPNLTKIYPQLFLSPKLEHAIGGSSMLRLPPYGTSDLKSYLEKVDVLLVNTVQYVSERFTRRKELVATFLAEFPGAVIEYDAEGFSEISLLLNHSSIFFVLYVIMEDQFPALPPTLVVQSTYHMAANGPFRKTYKEYRYSPRWESKLVVESIRKSLDSIVAEFKQDSFRSGKMT